MPLAQFGFLLPSDVRSEFGFQTSIVPANPALGAAFNRKVPGEFFEVPVSLSFAVDTSAVVADRLVVISVLSGDSALVDRAFAPGSQPASTSYGYRFSLAVTTAYIAAVTQMSAPLFAMVMPSGFTLNITSFNFQAGDQIRGIGLTLQQYETGIEPEATRALESPLVLSGEVVAPLPVAPTPASTSTPVGPAAPSSPSPAPLPPPPPQPAPQPQPDMTPGTFTIKPI